MSGYFPMSNIASKLHKWDNYIKIIISINRVYDIEKIKITYFGSVKWYANEMEAIR